MLSLFKKRNNTVDIESLVSDMANVADLMGNEVIVVRNPCKILYANTPAKARAQEGKGTHCTTDFAAGVPGLCAYCPYSVNREHAVGDMFEITDTHKNTYKGRCGVINWVDDKPAFLFVLQNITDEVTLKKRLLDLTYIDFLTGLPNRERLKEAFASLENRIIANEITGALVLFDLDHFKLINNTYGYETGDAVIKHMIEQLEGEIDFRGRIYRTGGDEFALLYTDPADRFETEEEVKKYYRNVLSTALRAYTLPMIELKSTLSMGISLFPQNGTSFSEVMRRADIALSHAKTDGRNQIVFFASHYDKAQKFDDVYVNIQPILSVEGDVYGYTLTDPIAPDENVNTEGFNRTLDILGMHNMEEKRHYFIAFTKRLLERAVLTNLPREHFVVCVGQPSTALLPLYRELVSHKYRLAVCGVNNHEIDPVILSLADYCVFSIKDGNLTKQRETIHAHPYKRFVAFGVDTSTEFNLAKEAGFRLFIGHYFKQPRIEKRTKDINPLKINYLRLIGMSNADVFLDYKQVSDIIASDVAFSYKLLRVLHSAAIGLKKITSVSSAIAYLGEDNLRKWIAMLALRGAVDGKPNEIIRLSMIRAHFGEKLAPHFHIRRSPQKLFMIGLISLLHIALDTTREKMMACIPVEEDIHDSLLTKKGIYSDMPIFYENYEHANWVMVTQFVQHHRLDPNVVNEAYLSSVKWYADLLSETV